MSNPLKKYAAAAALVSAFAAPAAAAPVLLTVTGTINSSNNIITDEPGTVIPTYAPYGTNITLTFLYDTTALDTNPNPNQGNFGAPQTSTVSMNGLSLSKSGTGLQPGSITQQLGANSFYIVNSGAYTTGLPAGIGSITTSFSAKDGNDIGALFADVNNLSDDLNALSHADTFNIALNFTGNGRDGVDFFIEETQLDNIRYTFNLVTNPPVGQVPEPSSLALIGAGLAGAYAVTRRRRETEAAPATSAPTLAA